MKQPFYIVAMPRSATTYLYKLLAAHPQVALTNESHVADFLSFCCELSAVPFLTPSQFTYFDEFEMRGMVAPEYLDRFGGIFRQHAVAALEAFYRAEFDGVEFTHWGDKLPTAHTAVELQTIYPNAKFIVSIRDPRDTLCSFRAYVARLQRQGKPFNAELLDQTAADWSRDWRNLYDGMLKYLTATHVVRYEELIRAPRGALAAALEFLGLEGAEPLLGEQATGELFAEHSTAPDPAATMGRWREELNAEDVAAVEATCGEVMARHGYAVGG